MTDILQTSAFSLMKIIVIQISPNGSKTQKVSNGVHFLFKDNMWKQVKDHSLDYRIVSSYRQR